LAEVMGLGHVGLDPRVGDRPVYLLTSKDTLSGAEGLAYDLQAHQRASLVGETTKGGAHPGSPYRIHPHLEVFIPDGRAINPVSGSNWEGPGVTPDVAVPQEQAPKTAYSMALKSVLASIGESPSEPLKALAVEAQTALEGLETR
jgi:C-terminal processing protease CtpA/Prc